MPEPKEAPVTVTGLAKYLPLAASAAVALSVSAFGWGVAWTTFQTRVDGLEGRVDKFEAVATSVDKLAVSVNRLEADAARPAFEERLVRIERLVGELVCLDDRADKELCRRALSGGRQ